MTVEEGKEAEVKLKKAVKKARKEPDNPDSTSTIPFEVFCPTCGRKHDFVEVPDYLLLIFSGTFKHLLAILIAARKQNTMVNRETMFEMLYPNYRGMEYKKQRLLQEDLRMLINVNKERLALFGWVILIPANTGYYWLAPLSEFKE